MGYSIAFMVGASAVIMGLSLMMRPAEWQEYAKFTRSQGTSASLMIGYLHLIIGTMIVGFHWEWSGLPLLLTLIGVKAIVEGIVYTLFPKVMIAMLRWFEARRRFWIRLAGMITVVVGLVVLCEWKGHMQLDCTWYPCFDQA